jgi:prepilin-type N-terminal cleavage/methylation domain-containing protein
MKYKLPNYQTDNQGFSLVELVVAMAITAVVMAGVYNVYVTQQDTYLIQEQVAEMQQNSRMAKYVLMRDIRMVGYNPTGKLNAGGFVTNFVAKLPGDDLADSDPDRTSTGSKSIAFTLDYNGNGVIDASLDEQIAYRVAGENLQRFDVDNDAWITVVENVDALGFAYAYEDGGNIIWAIDADDSDTDERLNVKLDGNNDGAIDASDDTNGDGVIDDNDAGTLLATPVELNKIVAVKIWLLTKTGRSDRRYSRSETYVVGNRIIHKNDQNRRNLVTTAVKCRNMAL